MLHLVVSLALVAATLVGARRFGVGPALLPACLPLAVALAGPFQWVLVSGLAPAPLMGLLAAVQVARGRPYGEVIAAASLPALGLALVLLAGLHGGLWPRQELKQAVVEALRPVADSAHMSSPIVLEEVADLTLRLLPAMAYAAMLLVAVLGYRVAQAMGVRLGAPLPTAPPLRCWRPWEGLIWVLVGALALVLLGRGVLRDLAINATLVMALLYAVQGLAVVRWLLWRLGAKRYLEGLVYALLALTSGVSLMALALSGLSDTWFDWRRLGHRRDDPAAEAGNAAR